MRIVPILLALFTCLICIGSCRRTGYDHPPGHSLPPEPVRLSTLERTTMDQAVAEVLERCRDNSNLPHLKRVPLVENHPLYPRFFEIFRRLLEKANDNPKDWRIYIFDGKENLPGDIVACQGGYLFASIGIFAENRTDNEIAIVLGHALGHAYANHLCMMVTLPPEGASFARSLMDVESYICRGPADALPEVSAPPAEPFPLFVRLQNKVEELVLVTLISPSVIFGDPGTIQRQRWMRDASFIGLYLAHEAGFDIEQGISKLGKHEDHLGERFGDLIESLRPAKKSLDDHYRLQDH